MLENLRLTNAKITYNDLICLKKDVPVNDQLEHLKEDLLQIEVASEFIVDVGYDPDFSPDGYFTTQLIRNYDWQNPVWLHKCKEISAMVASVQEAIYRANSIKN